MWCIFQVGIRPSITGREVTSNCIKSVKVNSNQPQILMQNTITPSSSSYVTQVVNTTIPIKPSLPLKLPIAKNHH